MKFIKEYINFNEFEYEESDYLDKPLNIGDKIIIIKPLYFYSYKFKFKWHKTVYLPYNELFLIIDIELSKNIDYDGLYKIKKGSIPFDGWLFKINDHWPWFKYEEEKIKKLT